MKITRNENPYYQLAIRPQEQFEQAQRLAERRRNAVEGAGKSAQTTVQKQPGRDKNSAKYKVEAAKRDFERKPEFPSQFIDRTV